MSTVLVVLCELLWIPAWSTVSSRTPKGALPSFTGRIATRNHVPTGTSANVYVAGNDGTVWSHLTTIFEQSTLPETSLSCEIPTFVRCLLSLPCGSLCVPVCLLAVVPLP